MSAASVEGAPRGDALPSFPSRTQQDARQPSSPVLSRKSLGPSMLPIVHTLLFRVFRKLPRMLPLVKARIKPGPGARPSLISPLLFSTTEPSYSKRSRHAGMHFTALQFGGLVRSLRSGKIDRQTGELCAAIRTTLNKPH